MLIFTRWILRTHKIEYLEPAKLSKIAPKYISGETAIWSFPVIQSNIENFIGFAQVP